ncbi:YgaP family membrane protein [Terribacillus saccharophilus]|uniref:YgaP family membrane protein n=1 Tax=Terribacillus saccharophilus TaxID=361277 RepID=UPI000BA5DB5F|nr:DUF2892 domain-containing protein [Terribacillus saccharophilus]MEC0282802.1 DUF2892 domain-containing protein [Terribacillus saccharophilus]MEC0292003.1 DUF2892 domain-containing protein [Terribacillus saccharophilus]MEC0302498.1 DUF2892 domain-containing protein [Terribacillus saccharophilus]PAF16962.1 hypothetical protein CHH51_14880 [Terribacillus saccharophilus]PAF21000.1 hypothetical protein CHH49_13200 [Terribacillus saccharophilus]
MKPNIGIIQAMIRIAAGVSMVGYATAALVTKPKQLTAHLTLLAGAIKIAEGIVRYCPSMTLINQFRQKQDSQGE